MVQKMTIFQWALYVHRNKGYGKIEQENRAERTISNYVKIHRDSEVDVMLSRHDIESLSMIL